MVGLVEERLKILLWRHVVMHCALHALRYACYVRVNRGRYGASMCVYNNVIPLYLRMTIRFQ